MPTSPSENIGSPTKPFLRWAGGKIRSVGRLSDHLPSDFDIDTNRYFEPFLGAGALFFRLQPLKATISDKNSSLTDCYKAIKKNPHLVIRELNKHLQLTNEEYYYKMRKLYNTSRSSLKKGALFIYLNKTCFNGIWRVNSKGQFNVPYGFREPPDLPSKENILNASKVLSRARILNKDYRHITRSIKKGDFVYFDPPYPPLNGTSKFTEYTVDGFNSKDHTKLAHLAKRLNKRGCFIMISNADTPRIRKLYNDSFFIKDIEVTRLIRSDGKRYKVGELIITNYQS